MKKYYKSDDPNKLETGPYDSKIVKAYLPESIYAKLKDQSRLQGMPMSRLIGIAIDNELDQEKPFDYPTDLPDDYIEYQYVNEASKLLNYICKFPRGVGRDVLCLSRVEIGFEHRATVLRALQELLEKGMVEEIMPIGTKFIFWPSDYRVIRAKDIQVKDRKVPKFKKVQGQSTKNIKRITDREVDRDED